MTVDFDVKSPAKREVTLDYLRVIAMGMILFCHLGLMRNAEWFAGKIVEDIFLKPLCIIEQFGKLAVCLFFFLSGYFFLPSLERAKNAFLWIAKKLLSLYVPAIAAVCAFFFFQYALGHLTPSASFWFQYSARQWFETITLLGFLNGGTAFNSPEWYLIPTMLFFVLGGFLFSLPLKNLYRRGGVYHKDDSLPFCDCSSYSARKNIVRYGFALPVPLRLVYGADFGRRCLLSCKTKEDF